MTLNLLMDSTRETLMLALASDTERLSRVEEAHESHRYHSSVMLPRIQAMLRENGFSPENLTGVAVNLGPGSFTGIRTSLIVARLLGQFQPIQTFGFNTFELIAAHPMFRGKSVTIILNAFRQQHYHAALQVDDTGEIRWLQAPQVTANEAPLAVDTEIFVMDSSLQGKLPPTPSTPLILEELGLFTPEAMLFFLQRYSQRYASPWQELKPMYLQLPHVTQAKTIQV